MSLRVRTAALAIAFVAGAMTIPVSVKGAHARKLSLRSICTKYRCHRIAADVDASVLTARDRHPAHELGYESSFVEWLPSGRVTAVGDRFEGRELKKLALAGRFVGAAVIVFGKEPPYFWLIDRINAATGRRETVDPRIPGGNEFGLGSPGVTDICITEAGTIGWIFAPNVNHPTIWRVLELPLESRTPHELAASPGVTRGSLACTTGHVYWLEAGVARSAPAP